MGSAVEQRTTGMAEPNVTWADDAGALVDSLCGEDERDDLLALLGVEEQDLTDVPMTRVVAALFELRGPYVQMLGEIARTTALVEGQLRSSIEVLTVADDRGISEIDLGDQMRGMIATAVDRRLFDVHRADITTRLDDLQRRSRWIDNLEPDGYVEDSLGGALRQVAWMERGQGRSEDAARTDAARRVVSRRKPTYADHDLLAAARAAELVDQIEHLVGSCWQLDQAQISPSVQRLTRRVRDLRRGPISAYLPDPTPRAGRQSRLRRPHTSWIDDATALVELLGRCSRQAESLDDLADFMRASLWKQRWRVYELWGFCWVVNRLAALGAEVEPVAERFTEGVWKLKFAKDSRPVSHATIDGVRLEIFYQYFSTSAGAPAASMPDVLVRRAGAVRATVVMDPKDYRVPKMSEFTEVCERYAIAHDPLLTAVVCSSARGDNDEQIQVLSPPASNPRVVLTGVVPESDPGARLAELFDDALLRERLAHAPEVPTLLYLDCSTSTVCDRDEIAARAAEFIRGQRHQAEVFPFDDDVHEPLPFVDTNTLADALDGLGGSTNIAAVLDHLRASAGRRLTQARIITDADGARQVTREIDVAPLEPSCLLQVVVIPA